MIAGLRLAGDWIGTKHWRAQDKSSAFSRDLSGRESLSSSPPLLSPAGFLGNLIIGEGLIIDDRLDHFTDVGS